jgi:hypothetical protein
MHKRLNIQYSTLNVQGNYPRFLYLSIEYWALIIECYFLGGVRYNDLFLHMQDACL